MSSFRPKDPGLSWLKAILPLSLDRRETSRETQHDKRRGQDGHPTDE